MSEPQQIDLKEIEVFLKTNFSNNISNIEQVRSGQRSKVFSFISNEIKYIFRINSHDDGFKKDKFACEHFSGSVPIPKIFKIGTFKDSYYSISEICQGSPLLDGVEELPSARVESIITTADKIHSIKVPKHANFGVADIYGNAKYESWDNWILKENTVVTKNDGSFYSWDEVKKIQFADEKIINNLYSRIKELVHFIPKERYLIHCDYGTGNIIVNNDVVTGVIDWNEYGYGDFLFDIAWLDFWISKTDFSKAYKEYFQKNNRIVPFYEERMQCHKLFIGLNTLGIYAAIGWEDGYKSTLDRIIKLGF